MSKFCPEYVPLINKHLRFFLSNPGLTDFASPVQKRQYEAVGKHFYELDKIWQDKLTEVMLYYPRTNDIGDSYISVAAREIFPNDDDRRQLFTMMNGLRWKIALELEYIW